MIKGKDYEESSGNVFEDLGFKNPEEELLKAKLSHCVYKAISEKKLTQNQAAKLMGISCKEFRK